MLAGFLELIVTDRAVVSLGGPFYSHTEDTLKAGNNERGLCRRGGSRQKITLLLKNIYVGKCVPLTAGYS